MTNPIPGADSERAAFEAWAKAACEIPFYAAINWNADWTQAAFEGWQARAAAKVGADEKAIFDVLHEMRIAPRHQMEEAAKRIAELGAAKVGANVAAPVTEERIHTWINGIGGGIWKDGALTLRRDELVAAIRGIVNLAAGAPAETPKPCAHARQKTMAGTGWTCQDCGKPMYNRPIPDAAMLANSSSGEAG